MTFKVGDRVRRVRNPRPWAPEGFEATLYWEEGLLRYKDMDGERLTFIGDYWELVSPALTLEVGKDYKARNGQKVALSQRAYVSSVPYAFIGTSENGVRRVYQVDGEHGVGSFTNEPEWDIVAEWSEGPVRTVTVTTRRIVPGVYGRLEVGGVVDGRVHVLIQKGEYTHRLTADELDSLAMVASQLAEALRDG